MQFETNTQNFWLLFSILQLFLKKLFCRIAIVRSFIPSKIVKYYTFIEIKTTHKQSKPWFIMLIKQRSINFGLQCTKDIIRGLPLLFFSFTSDDDSVGAKIDKVFECRPMYIWNTFLCLPMAFEFKIVHWKKTISIKVRLSAFSPVSSYRRR